MDNVKTPGQQGRQYDLNEIFKLAFGHVRPPYPTVVLESKQLGLNPIGTVKALRGAFKFSSGLGTDFTLPTKLNGFQLPNEPTIGINGGKNIKETKLTRLDSLGRLNRQNVLEEINLNNFKIRIRGLLINEDNPDDYPEDQLMQLRDICLAGGSISIDNAITNMWGIQYFALEDFDFPPVKGNIAFQAYDLIGYSDEIIDLEVVESK